VLHEDFVRRTLDAVAGQELAKVLRGHRGPVRGPAETDKKTDKKTPFVSQGAMFDVKQKNMPAACSGWHVTSLRIARGIQNRARAWWLACVAKSDGTLNVSNHSRPKTTKTDFASNASIVRSTHEPTDGAVGVGQRLKIQIFYRMCHMCTHHDQRFFECIPRQIVINAQTLPVAVAVSLLTEQNTVRNRPSASAFCGDS